MGIPKFPLNIPDFLKLEELFASFTDLERVIITLYLELDYDPEKLQDILLTRQKNQFNIS
ncbi:MAG: hypothetical protein IPJ75_12075 [Ignavibacteriales bacterium]|nr:hypothetical protein [Ignavibacteriales bacterium]